MLSPVGFDRVDHSFLFKVLEKFGFGPGFMGLVRSFYEGATSRVLINGVFSEPIDLGRGVRQGDSPSSLLYVLTAEVLAITIRKDTSIKGLTIGGVEKKIGGYADDTQGFLSSDASILGFLRQVTLYGKASGSKLNKDKTEGLWLGPWKDRGDQVHGLKWKEKIKVLGIWVGWKNMEAMNFQDMYTQVRARLHAWKGRPLSALGKVKVANIFLYSSMWYKTEVVTPAKEDKGQMEGYGRIEKEIENWLFWGRQEVGCARLRDAFEKGGAQLVDIGDKIRTQRVMWLKRLWHMPENSFPRIVANELIGQHKAGYKGLDALMATGSVFKSISNAFYRTAITAWQKLEMKYYHGNKSIDEYRLWYNPLFTNENGEPFQGQMAVRGVYTVAELKTKAQQQNYDRVKKTIEKLLQRIPLDVQGTDDPDFTFKGPDGSDFKLAGTSFKEVYSSFRNKVKVDRHYEAKWEVALNSSLEGEWTGIWQQLHCSGASLRARSAVWRQINLNFWTCYMDYAYIKRGDGVCEMCGEPARERWHTITLCGTVLQLWERLKPHLEALDKRAITEKEMGLGLSGNGDNVKLRNRLAYTLRSAVLAMRWIHIRDVDRAADNIWSSFLYQLKRELVEDYWVAKTKGDIGYFTRTVLTGGVLGQMDSNNRVQWAAWLRDIKVRYWDLFH